MKFKLFFLYKNQVQEDAERIAITPGALEWLVVPVTYTFRMSYLENSRKVKAETVIL